MDYEAGVIIALITLLRELRNKKIENMLGLHKEAWVQSVL